MAHVNPIAYLWKAVANWVCGFGSMSPLVMNHFLVIALCITVVMFGLISIFHTVGSLCRLVQQRNPVLGEKNVRLLSATPPPVEKKFGTPPSRVFSVIEGISSRSPTPVNLPINDVKIVERATLVGDNEIGSPQQYVLLSDSFPQQETTLVLSTEHSHRFCPVDLVSSGV